jgi:hypothetical protein
MSHQEAIAAIVVGTIVGLVGLFGTKFYAGRGYFLSDRSIDPWVGRLIFGVVGLFMILGGMIFLFPNR